MARTIVKNTVLPEIPYSPSLPALPQVSLVNDTLPARNAMGQGLTQAGPRPSAPVVNMPDFVVPPTTAMDMKAWLAVADTDKVLFPICHDLLLLSPICLS